MIRSVESDKEKFMDILLIGDEQEEMIGKYLDRGELFVYEENGKDIAVCVITNEGNRIYELKNIAVLPEFQHKGIGKKLLDFAEQYCRPKADKLVLGTGDSPLTVPFYEKCGYKRTHTVKNFFIDNYDHPIIEAGVQLVDMIYFEKELR